MLGGDADGPTPPAAGMGELLRHLLRHLHSDAVAVLLKCLLNLHPGTLATGRGSPVPLRTALAEARRTKPLLDLSPASSPATLLLPRPRNLALAFGHHCQVLPPATSLLLNSTDCADNAADVLRAICEAIRIPHRALESKASRTSSSPANHALGCCVAQPCTRTRTLLFSLATCRCSAARCAPACLFEAPRWELPTSCRRGRRTHAWPSLSCARPSRWRRAAGTRTPRRATPRRVPVQPPRHPSTITTSLLVTQGACRRRVPGRRSDS